MNTILLFISKTHFFLPINLFVILLFISKTHFFLPINLFVKHVEWCCFCCKVTIGARKSLNNQLTFTGTILCNCVSCFAQIF